MKNRNRPANHEPMEDGSTGKKCNRCFTVKSLGEYSKNSAKWDALSEYCRSCGVAYKIKNQDAINAKNARYREKHHEVVKERVRLCVRKRRSKMALGEMARINREYRAKDPEKWKKISKEWVKANPDKIRENCRKSFQKRKKKIRVYLNNRRKTDPVWAVSCRLRERLCYLLRKRKIPKASKSYALIGCDAATVKRHLEGIFTEGMTWEVFHTGVIHIDHIKPLAKFDLTTEEGQRSAFHYTNLQPLWAADNWAKSDKWTEPAPDPSPL